MLVAQLLVDTGGLDPQVSFELLRQAEMRGVADARCFLLQVAAWGVCDAATVWRLRKVYNQGRGRGDRLWVPLTA